MMKFLQNLAEAYSCVSPVPTTPESPWSVQQYLELEPDSIGIEVEFQFMLYGLVLTLKPEVVIETGCRNGGTSVVLAEALKANGKGELWLTEIDPGFKTTALNRVRGRLPDHRIHFLYGLEDRLQPEIASVLGMADLAVIDSSFESRVKEMDCLKKGCVAFVHDTGANANLGREVEKRFERRVFLKTTKGAHLIWV